MKKVVTLGEIMLRLTTPGFDKIEQARNFAATYGGGEANVAISLAQLGLDTSYVTKLPENPLGHTVNQFLTGLGVGTEHIIYGGGSVLGWIFYKDLLVYFFDYNNFGGT